MQCSGSQIFNKLKSGDKKKSSVMFLIYGIGQKVQHFSMEKKTGGTAVYYCNDKLLINISNVYMSCEGRHVIKWFETGS